MGNGLVLFKSQFIAIQVVIRGERQLFARTAPRDPFLGRLNLKLLYGNLVAARKLSFVMK